MDLTKYTDAELGVIASLLVDAADGGATTVEDLKDLVLADLADRDVAKSYVDAF